MIKPRILEPNRAQVRLVPSDLESLIAADHPVRSVWAYVCQLDLSIFLTQVRSVGANAGRPAIDPRILLGLWIQATLDGVGSARELERLTREHVVYQWICGGVNVNYHTLSDFRSLSSDLLDSVLAEGVMVLLESGLAEMTRVAHDGMKVRASAGASSFRTRHRLRKLREAAVEQIEHLREELKDDQGASRNRQQAARERAATERLERIEEAQRRIKDAEKRKRSNNGKKKTKARVSTTDPQARVMKMPDGGFRPAYNVHLVTETKEQIILECDVTDEGTDTSMAVPLANSIKAKHGRTPEQWLYDGGCNSHENLKALTELECEVFAPIRPARTRARNRTQVRATDPDYVASWRTRMSTTEAKRIYPERAATAECVNGHFRNNGLRQFLVRSLKKVKSVVLLHAVTHNFSRMKVLGVV